MHSNKRTLTPAWSDASWRACWYRKGWYVQSIKGCILQNMCNEFKLCLYLRNVIHNTTNSGGKKTLTEHELIYSGSITVQNTPQEHQIHWPHVHHKWPLETTSSLHDWLVPHRASQNLGEKVPRHAHLSFWRHCACRDNINHFSPDGQRVMEGETRGTCWN